MPRTQQELLAWNRGLVSPLALARADVQRVALSAEVFQNFIPRVFGSMMLRPGTAYLATLSSASWFLPFIYAADDTALIKFTDAAMTVYVGDAVITRGSVSTSITNGAFTSNVTNWTDADETGATSAWVTGGYLGLTGTGTLRAIRRQTVSVAAGDQNDEHGIKVVIARGPVTLRIGTSSGDDDLFSGELGTGEHSLAVTPTGANMYIELSSADSWLKLVDSISIESAAAISLTSPYAAADLSSIRWDQSADVVYLACAGYEQYKIERRATRSWSLVKYETQDGPFLDEHTGSITLTPSDISGEITLTASQNLFKSGHVGALFRIESVGQKVTVDASAENTFTDEIRVTGVENTRRFTILTTGTWSGTMTLQRSIVEPGSWTDVQTWTGNTSVTYDDGLDNQIVYYRIGFKSGDYSSGTLTATLTYNGGSITGVVKVRTVSSETQASVTVLKNLGGTDGSNLWAEGAWSSYRGYPSSVAFYEGRLWWAGKSRIFGSVSDSYEGFDDMVEGDSGPISRTIGQGPVDGINWMLPLDRLILGTASAEKSCRSSSFDEPLTPSQFSIKNCSTQGSAAINAVVMDTSGIYVQRSGLRVYELAYDGGKFTYGSIDLTRIVPLVCSPGVSQVAVQRQPDTRIHCVLSDGTVAMLVHDELEQVRCWLKIVTDGSIEQVIVLPGTSEDAVYYVVNRDSGRFLEKWAQETEADGGTTNKCVDSHVVYSGSATTSITGLDHLEGESVVVWADGDSVNDDNGDVKTFTVSSGAITLDTAASDVIVGLAYTAKFQSTKLPRHLSTKIVKQIGLILGATHRKGLQYGPDFTYLDDLPDIEEETTVTSDYASYDEPLIPFNGTWDTDTRVCLQAASPRHATVMGVLVEMESGA